MNLLHINAAYSPFLGGAEVYTQTISERFARDGHKVSLVTSNAAEVEYFWNPRKRHVPPGPDRLNGVEIVRSRVSHLPLSPWSFYVVRRLATFIARLPMDTTHLLRRFAPLLPGMPDVEATLESLPGPFDLVHGINIALEWPLLAAWRYARRRHLPFVTTPFVHVGEHGRQDVLINYVMPHQLEVLRDADAVIVQTDVERQVLTRLGVAPDRLHRHGMGVNLDELAGGVAQRFRSRYKLANPIATFLGVVTYDKGSFHLVQAMERLWAAGRDLHLVIAGPPVDEFVHFFDRLPPATRDRILLLGSVTGQDKQDLLAATDIFALPSRVDAFGIVYLEAWAYGKPVIGARAGGVPDVIDDEQDGLLIDFGNVPQLTQALTRLLEHPEQAQSLGARGRDKVRRLYTWNRIYDLTRDVYGSLATITRI